MPRKRKIYIVNLTEEERTSLLVLIKSGERSARKLNRARILLLADDGRSDREIAEALHSSTPTVQRTRQRFVEGGPDNALHERRRPGARKKLDEKGEALLETLACSEPPAGRKRWTLQLLADRLVELRVVDNISYETVRRELKKTAQALGEEEMGYSQRRRRVCVAHGRRFGRVCLALQPQTTTGLLRREAGPTDYRDAPTAAGQAGTARALRLRIQTQWHA